MGHYFARMGHHSAPMGHHFVQMGHEMGHYSAPVGHHFAKMGHEGTPMDIKTVSHIVMVKRQANKGLSTGFLGAEWPKNQVTVPKGILDESSRSLDNWDVWLYNHQKSEGRTAPWTETQF
jgi:hypothetical protein